MGGGLALHFFSIVNRNEHHMPPKRKSPKALGKGKSPVAKAKGKSPVAKAKGKSPVAKAKGNGKFPVPAKAGDLCNDIHNEGAAYQKHTVLLLENINILHEIITSKVDEKKRDCSDCDALILTEHFNDMQELLIEAEHNLTGNYKLLLGECYLRKKQIEEQHKDSDSKAWNAPIKVALQNFTVAQKTVADDMQAATIELSTLIQEVAEKFNNLTFESCSRSGLVKKVWGGIKAVGKFMAKGLARLWELIKSITAKLMEHKMTIALATMAITFSVALAPYVAIGLTEGAAVMGAGIGGSTQTGAFISMASRLGETLCHFTLRNPASGYIIAATGGLAYVLFKLLMLNGAGAGAIALKNMLCGGSNTELGNVARAERVTLSKSILRMAQDRGLVGNDIDEKTFIEQSMQDLEDVQNSPGGILYMVMSGVSKVAKIGVLSLLAALVAMAGTAISWALGIVGAVVCNGMKLITYASYATDMAYGGVFKVGETFSIANALPPINDSFYKSSKFALESLANNVNGYSHMVTNVSDSIFGALQGSNSILGNAIGALSLYSFASVAAEENGYINLEYYQYNLEQSGNRIVDNEKRKELFNSANRAVVEMNNKPQYAEHIGKFTHRFRVASKDALESFKKCE